MLRDRYYLYLKHGRKGVLEDYGAGTIGLHIDNLWSRIRTKMAERRVPPHHRRNYKEGQCGKVTSAAVVL
ncbi:MAG: hypothetical protein PHC68_02800 [Syntrophorhabdaceae bacterium]|nr:hypothetical protein [Syntrophorhabdaceae bacterium]